MRVLIGSILLIALVSVGCAECRDVADPDDLVEPDVASSSDDAGADARSTGDTQLLDGADRDLPDSCVGASSGASCDDEGVVCNYTCDGVCSWCSGLQCAGGTWELIEDAPHLFCDRPCHPVTDPCTDATYSSCQYVDAIEDFRCFEPGESESGESCTPNVEYEDDVVCAEDLHCVTDETGGGSCVRLCDPVSQDPAECPYGCKPASDFGVEDPDLGFCIVPTGQTCVDDAPGRFGPCDLFVQDCRDGQVCDVVVIAGGELRFDTACVDDDGTYTEGEKEPCASAEGRRCAAGLKCYEPTQTCTFLCRLSDGYGCTAGQSCRDVYQSDFGIGMCADDCG